MKHSRPTAVRRGFTLVELLIALMVSALVTAGVTAMLVSVSYGTSSNHDMRGLVVKGQVLDARLTAAIRSCHQVVSVGTSPPSVLLWVRDGNDNDVQDNAELQLVEFNSATQQLNSRFDSAAAGAYVNLSTLRGLVSAEIWGTGITACSFQLVSGGSGQDLVRYSLTLADGDMSEPIRGAAAVRN